MIGEDWRSLANCRNTPDAMFPENDDGDPIGGTAQSNAYKYAQRVCENCAVRNQCLQFALDNHVNEGVWGGLTPRQRRKLRRVA